MSWHLKNTNEGLSWDQLGQRVNMCWDSLQHSNPDFLGLSLEALQMPCKWFRVWYYHQSKVPIISSSRYSPLKNSNACWACNSKKERGNGVAKTEKSISHLGLLVFYLWPASSWVRKKQWQHGDFWVLQCTKSEAKTKRESVGRSTWNEGKIWKMSLVSWKLPKSLLLQILWIHWIWAIYHESLTRMFRPFW